MTANVELLAGGQISDRSDELRQQYGCKVQFSGTRFLMALRMADPGTL
jgi:hypothetical protein